uniref:Uncharacterized protein n=1 Tax=viral metagenome TaxID=1070528 RepID=A0A6C0LH42_9ZZZZ
MTRTYTEYNATIDQASCAITGTVFNTGDKILRYDNTEYLAILDSMHLPHDVGRIVLEQTDLTSLNIGQWILADCIITKKRTRSGRAVKPVIQQAILQHVKGSGMPGCDSYDQHFDRGVDSSWQAGRGDDSEILNCDLDGFVVDDSEPIEYEEEVSEKEWIDDEESDEEEEEEDEWSACESDDDSEDSDDEY